uniref:cache domain-containing protein n=1 Tax=Ningiella ruwaisensis TaxID=2364274 RepID=UPI00109F013B|nr:cache domain-containing protein [Ningiella ruwaisensis]
MAQATVSTKKVTAFAAIIVLMIALSGFFAIKDLAGEQSQQHHQSISPIFTLVEQELLNPLHTAEVISDLGTFSDFFKASSPDEDAVIPILKSLEDTFGHEFYLAHEESRKQFNSSGRVFDLIEGEVIWYFALRDEFDSEVQAVLGKREDVHLYIDVREYDEEGNFLGFTGLGKSLDAFLSSFNEFSAQYGHEFIFVNNRGEIVLSSIESLSPTQAVDSTSRIGIKAFSELEWFNEFTRKSEGIDDPSVVVRGQEGSLLVSRLQLQSLGWNLYVLTPLDTRQQEVNIAYILYVGISAIILFIVFRVVFHIVERYLHRNDRVT